MGSRGSSLLVLLAAIALFTQACTDTAVDPTSPVDPQFAKGGKPVQPPEPAAEPILEEFWIYNDEAAGCEQMVHMVASGTFLEIGDWVTHDHFFNGVQDDDPPLDTHYEFFFSGPATRPMDYRDDIGMGHVDVCFTGQRKERLDDSGEVESQYFFRDYPATSVDGTGADPFAISPVVVIERTERSEHFKSFEPMGVVVGGKTKAQHETSVTSAWHDGQTFSNVSSYAVFKGAEPSGSLFFSELTIENVSCKVTTKVEGRGKEKVSVAVAAVSADVTIGYGATNGYNQNYWGEGHLRVKEVGADEAFLSDRIQTPQRNLSFTLSRDLDLDGDLSGRMVEVEFVADFLHATSGDATVWITPDPQDRYDWIYNPGRNNPAVRTTAGYDGSPWNALTNVSTVPGDEKFPVAHSNTVLVTCR